MTEGQGIKIGMVSKSEVQKPVRDPKPPDPALKQAAQSFEAYFIYSLLKEMRKTVPSGGSTGSGKGQEIYQSLLDEALAKKMSESGGIGLSKLLIQKYRG